jgi:signal transduction histidine kinase/ActR/RegA family two-component response regulator
MGFRATDPVCYYASPLDVTGSRAPEPGEERRFVSNRDDDKQSDQNEIADESAGPSKTATTELSVRRPTPAAPAAVEPLSVAALPASANGLHDDEATDRPTQDLHRRQLGARLVELVGPGAGRSYRLSRENLIGRDPKASVHVTAEDVSRRHARIWREWDGAWMIEDLDSRNGTLLNGVPVARDLISFGDHVQLGATLLYVFTYYDQLQEQILQVQRLESIGSMAGGVAHDFNNLLSVVIGNLDYLDHRNRAKKLDSDSISECLGEMRRATERAERLIHQLLDFSRPEKGGAEAVDFTALAYEAIDFCQRTAKPGVKFETTIEERLTVHGNPTQLHQMIMNLLVNARDAMPAGGKLSFRATRTKLERDAIVALPFVIPGPYVRVVVSDTGIGMSEETRQRAFEPFFTTKKDGKGTGLGLSTVYALVRNHGGHVYVESEVDKGASFTVHLPAIERGRREYVTQRMADTIDNVREEAILDAPRVLLVDDDSAVLRSTARLLAELGYEVLTASDGKQAIDLYEKNRRENDVKLVLLDVVMPGMDGADVLTALLQRDPGARVLLISGRCESKDVQPLLRRGARGFVRKPCGAKNLRQAIASALM